MDGEEQSGLIAFHLGVGVYRIVVILGRLKSRRALAVMRGDSHQYCYYSGSKRRVKTKLRKLQAPQSLSPQVLGIFYPRANENILVPGPSTS